MSNALRSAFSSAGKLFASVLLQREQAKIDDATWEKRQAILEKAIAAREAATQERALELERVRQQGQTEQTFLQERSERKQAEIDAEQEALNREAEERRFNVAEEGRNRRHQSNLASGKGQPSPQARTIWMSPDGSEMRYFGPDDEIPAGWVPKDVGLQRERERRKYGDDVTAPPAQTMNYDNYVQTGIKEGRF